VERLITVAEKNKDLLTFLKRLIETGCSYEVAIEDGKITNIYVRIPDNGDWSEVRYGRILGSKVVSYIQTTYRPRIVDGNFIYNHNENKKRV
jgi:hypothetical protein